MTIALTAACAILLLILFGATGNTHEPQKYGHSVISWLVLQWMDNGSQYEHGWLIPAVSIFFVWRRRLDFFAAPKQSFAPAILLIAFLLSLYWLGYRAQQPRLGVVCMIGLLWALPLYLFGKNVASLLFFPCVYLVFMIPMGFLSSYTFSLRLVATKISVGFLNGLGVDVVRIGTAIISDAGKGFRLDVEDPCSGLNSIIALTALTAAYAYYTQKDNIRRWLLFLAAVPIAIAGNVIRIITITVVARVFGSETATKVYHDASGYIVFVSATILMIAIGKIISLNPSTMVKSWIPQRQNTSP